MCVCVGVFFYKSFVDKPNAFCFEIYNFFVTRMRSPSYCCSIKVDKLYILGCKPVCLHVVHPETA